MSSGFNQDDQGFYQGQYGANYPGYSQENTDASGYDIGTTDQFPQDQQFQQFDYSQNTYAEQQGAFVDNSYPVPHTGYTGSIMTPDPVQYTPPDPNSFEDEPPLMEELGINFDHIWQKTMAVLNPVTKPDTALMQDTDLAGPLVFCLAFGGSLLLSGKVHFGYIYGISILGCLAMYCLLNLMSMLGVSASCVVSILGYCLLPMVLLSFLSVVLSLQGLLGTVFTAITVLWCSVSASKLFVSALSMDQQQLLIAYPCALVYGVFALLIVF